MHQGENDPHLLEQALEQLRSELGETLTNALMPILRLNSQRCRPGKYLHLNQEGTIQTYILHVAGCYQADHAYLDQIQQQKNVDSWEPLLEKIRKWTYRFLGRWQLDEPTRIINTQEITQEAAIQILHAHYPYDCVFDAWACIISQHACSKYMQRHGTLPVIDAMDLSEADEWFGALDGSNPETELAAKQLLLNAVAQLTEKQKKVVWYFYFEGWPLPQIATHLQVNVNTIYKRHFDALKQLRKIFEENQHKDE
ncbi:MAG: sigma-70 family RNA polymerase sigma factor [Chloroflexota bacterium]